MKEYNKILFPATIFASGKSIVEHFSNVKFIHVRNETGVNLIRRKHANRL